MRLNGTVFNNYNHMIDQHLGMHLCTVLHNRLTLFTNHEGGAHESCSHH